CGVIFLSLHHAFEGSSGHDRLPHQARSPTDWATARVDSTNNGMEKRRTIPTALHIVFARPHHLYWNSRSLRHMNSFHHEIRLGRCPTTEPSTQECGMNLHLLVRKAGGLGCGCTVHCLELRSSPYLARVRPQIHRAVQRLHRQMGEVRHLVNRFDLLCSLRERAIGIAIPAHTLAR